MNRTWSLGLPRTGHSSGHGGTEVGLARSPHIFVLLHNSYDKVRNSGRTVRRPPDCTFGRAQPAVPDGAKGGAPAAHSAAARLVERGPSAPESSVCVPVSLCVRRGP